MSENKRIADLVAFVQAHYKATGRGCETFRVQNAGWKVSDLQDAYKAQLLEAQRGRTGGIFPFGEKPVTEEKSTLKGDAFAFLKALAENKGAKVDMAAVKSLIARYDAECEKRSEAKRGESED